MYNLLSPCVVIMEMVSSLCSLYQAINQALSKQEILMYNLLSLVGEVIQV